MPAVGIAFTFGIGMAIFGIIAGFVLHKIVGMYIEGAMGGITYAAQNKFVVNDGTGTAELSTCPTWYKEISLHEGETVTVIGQIMNQMPSMHKCDFTLSVYKIFRDREVIIVRGQPGKPPWVGYRPSAGQTDTGY